METPLQSVFGSRSRLEVLRCLYEAQEPLSGREIARRTGLSHQQAHNALKSLVSLGVIARRISPPAHLFSLNRSHWIVKELAGILFKKEKKWLDDLINELGRKMPKSVRSLILFGSAAQGRMHAGSDIDLLALVEQKKEKEEVLDYFTERSGDLLSRHHYPLAPVVLTTEEFRSRYKRNEGFARNVLKTGRVMRGKLLTEIL